MWLIFFFKLSRHVALHITSTSTTKIKPFSREIALVNINKKESGNKERSSRFFFFLYIYKSSIFWKQNIFYFYYQEIRTLQIETHLNFLT